MRVYFIGSHATGKTTLARYISKQYKLPMLNEVARTVLAEKELSLGTLRTDLDVVNSYQSDVFTRQIEEEKKHKSFVSDRSFDNLAYMAQHATILSSVINSEQLKQYVAGIKNDKNAIMFFVRPSRATMKDDGVRESVNWDGVIAIDALVKFLLEMWDMNYVSISTDSMQERVRTIRSICDLVIGSAST